MQRLFGIPLILFSAIVGGVLLALALQTTGHEFIEALLSAETLFALRLSLTVSVTAIAIALALGIPSGYALSKATFPGRILVEILLDLPMVMTPLIAGIGLLFLLGPGLLGNTLANAGLDFLFSPLGAIAAQAFIATPILVRSAKTAFDGLDFRYDWAAQTIGLTPSQTFFHVTLPLAGRELLSGTVLAWARAVGEFGATLMVAGATRMKTETLPIAVYLNITSGETGIAVACAWILIGFGFFLLCFLKLLQRMSPQSI